MIDRRLKYARVAATPEEVAAYRKRKGTYPAVHRFVCKDCKKRLWGSGLGIGSHNRACKGGAK